MNPAVLRNRLARHTEHQMQLLAEPAYEQLPHATRRLAELRQAVVRVVVDEVTRGASPRTAAQLVMARVQAGVLPPTAAHAVQLLGTFSGASLERWTREYIAGGLLALTDKRNGRQRKDYGWEVRAVAMFQQPTRPAYSTVAHWLREEGYRSATDSRVRRYLQSLPSSMSDTAPARVGRHFYDQNIRPHHRRDLSTINVGEIWQADGHCCDVYVQHPVTGKHYRPELTVWIDLASNYIVGWWLSESESAVTTLYSLSSAIRAHDHVPTWIHVDPGSGFKNRVMSDQALGFYTRLGCEVRTTIPGNAKGKGLIEGWFRWFEERLGKRYESFCGHCRTDDALNRFATKVRRGEIKIPTLRQYADAVGDYIRRYNDRPQPTSQTLQGKSPAELWAGLTRTPLGIPVDALVRPHKECAVRRWEVRLHHRYYRAAELAHYERRAVTVEYDLHDESRVWIRDAKQRLVCEAVLVGKTQWAGESVIADAREKSRLEKVKRHERAIEEIDARNRGPITAAAWAEPLAAPEEARARLTQQLAIEAAADAAENDDDETAEQRFARAQALERADAISEAEARWLEIYQDSAEYHARCALHDEFNNGGGHA